MILVVIFYYDVIMMSKTVISIPHFKRNSSSGGLIFGLLFQQSQISHNIIWNNKEIEVDKKLLSKLNKRWYSAY